MKSAKSQLKNNIYLYSGINHHGQTIEGEIEAVSINLANYYLNQKKINILKISKKNVFYFLKNNKKISALEIAFFFRQLAALVAAEIPLVQSCYLLQKSQNKAEEQINFSHKKAF